LREERRLRVFENRVLRRVFGPKRDEVTGDWRKLHNENFNDLYLPNTFRLIKSTRMRLAERVPRLGSGEVYTGFWWGNLRERYRLGDPCSDGRIILRWIFRKWNVGGIDWIELIQDRDSWRALVIAVMNIRVA
jgi:hypothetical protein